MESIAQLVYVLASSTLWLTASGLMLWLYLQSRHQLSPATRAAASILVVLQGWIWIGIPVQLGQLAQVNEFAQLEQVWSHWKAAEIALQKSATVDAVQAMASLQIDSRPAQTTTSPPIESRPSVAAIDLPALMRLTNVVVAAIWAAGIAIIIWRSVGSFVALCRMIQTLPLAPAEWQYEFSALCVKRNIRSPLALKVSNVAAPMLFQTWGRASIVVPAWLWESCTADQRTSILLHELAHYQRRDIWRQFAVRLLVLPHWFNPVAWWAARQFEAASEAACDETACGDNSLHAIGYAKALLTLNERAGLRYAQALSISGSSLTERIRRVLCPEFKESQMSRFLVLSSLMLLTGLATIRIQAAGQAPPAKSETAKNDAGSSNAASLLPNGGFEEFDEETGDPLSWGPTRVARTPDGTGLAGHYLLSASPSLAHGGKRSVMVAIGENHPALPVAYNWTTEVQGWKAGETYDLSGWLKTEKAKQPAFIMVQFWDKNADPKAKRMIGGAGTEKDFPIKGDTDWTKVSTRFTVPEGTGSLRLRAGLASKGNRGAKAWLDDLSLVKIASK
ncbi:MAG TPA: M56 family metallopeptidase [Pirellulaceae bacterium]|jgi:beta-lactamase regulating signal transducer with metallopeptidase domain